MTKMTADQMISYMKNIENGERLLFLEYLSNAHFNSGQPIENMILAVRNHIEDYLDRILSEEEIEIMNIAYKNGHGVGFNVGMERALKGEE